MKILYDEWWGTRQFCSILFLLKIYKFCFTRTFVHSNFCPAPKSVLCCAKDAVTENQQENFDRWKGRDWRKYCRKCPSSKHSVHIDGSECQLHKNTTLFCSEFMLFCFLLSPIMNDQVCRAYQRQSMQSIASSVSRGLKESCSAGQLVSVKSALPVCIKSTVRCRVST